MSRLIKETPYSNIRITYTRLRVRLMVFLKRNKLFTSFKPYRNIWLPVDYY